jgi:hypothetical protein
MPDTPPSVRTYHQATVRATVHRCHLSRARAAVPTAYG